MRKRRQSKMKCPFKDCGNKEDNTFFDTAVEHLIIVMNAKGHTHIHGPFDNEFVIRKMADALITELRKNGINYVPQPQQDKE